MNSDSALLALNWQNYEVPIISYKVYGDSALLALNRTLLNSDSALLALN